MPNSGLRPVPAGAALVAASVSLPAAAEDMALNAGDTAWVVVAAALVLLVTLPGLAMFYAGLVRARAALSVFVQCFAIACLASVIWLAVGYSLAFDDSVYGVVGGLGNAFFAGIAPDTLAGSIPEIVFAVFQMTFAIVAASLMVGAFVERIKFHAALIVSALWLVAVYAPVCHWVRGDGWLAALGAMDFTGGLAVHVAAGVSALVLAAAVGPRRDFPDAIRPPHSPGMAAAGAALLWVGWFGFSGGSRLAADGGAGMAIAAVHFAAASGAIVWSAIEWARTGKMSLVGAATGAVAGLAAAAPASGFVGPVGGVLLGAAAGAVCRLAADRVRRTWKIDDSLGVFAVHGAGGILGILLVAALAGAALGGHGLPSGVTVAQQLGVQTLGVIATVAWAALVTFVIARVVALLVGGLRVDEEDEAVGLDLATHGEQGYDL